MDETLLKLLELSYKGYYCSQVLVIMALEAQGKENPDLIRALGGLANGCGSDGGICGTLTGAACLLGLYAGKGTDDEHEDEMLKYMLNDLTVWFEQTVGSRYGGITCGLIVGDRTEVRQRCGAIVAETYDYAMQLLASSGYDVSRGQD
ncbi:DVU_1555 family C-GCAxxG-C-C protein [Geobacter sp.]|uniref:DVU_1555 family C-GCAxxG-C-C protein n=1 Tax=Geobacter sp. TaxID=46610 RepID=UPI002610D592|nr:DV_1555 family C-GCAxxG-C-C protein [Geobacter sp.]